MRGFKRVVNIKNTNMTFNMPQRADLGSCAYDFFSPCDVVIKAGEQKLIWTDVKAYMEPDEALLINVRSSHGKYRIQLANTIGQIDSTYFNNPDNEGNIGVFLRNEGTEDYIIKTNDRICQGMFIKYLITDDDKPMSKERTGGFGSSGV
jgi:dUTP pyrophosphatase